MIDNTIEKNNGMLIAIHNAINNTIFNAKVNSIAIKKINYKTTGDVCAITEGLLTNQSINKLIN